MCDGGADCGGFVVCGCWGGYCAWWLCVCYGSADCGGFVVCGCWGGTVHGGCVGVMGVPIVVVL